ncbi:PaaX family transcriptional regulator [Alteromonas sp.]|nr:PaaX family transcriptional regulator [Alteromonas sp.]
MLAMENTEKPTPRRLLLKLFSSRNGVQMNASSAVRVGALFGISENNIRVTLTRLQSANLLQLVERGFYELGAEGKLLANEINAWPTVEATLCSWREDWIAVLTNTLEKSDRKAKRARERAFKLTGMQEVSNDFYIRPNNVIGGVNELRKRLFSLGLDKRAMVFNTSQFSTPQEELNRRQWQSEALEEGYQKGLQAIQQSLVRLNSLPLEEAAKESYLVGDNALQQLVFDPLLPAPLVDVSLRKLYRAKVHEYDQAGAAIWQQFLALDG